MGVEIHVNLKRQGMPFRGYVVKYRITKALQRRKKTGNSVIIALSQHISIGRRFGVTLAEWNKEMNPHYNYVVLGMK